MKLRLFLFSILLSSAVLRAQDNASPADKEAAYARTIQTRAEKIVAALNLTDARKSAKLSELVAGQYKALNNVYTARDLQVKTAKESPAADKEAQAAKLKSIEDETAKATKALHASFLKNLSAQLTPAQVDQIKDGMTYNVLHVTYDAYQSMIPTLTGEQKAQILTWLTEAREYAMDAESSDKKHAWFGKYKGRINNYLAAQGYDLQKERQAWGQRQKAGTAQQ